MNSDIKSTPSPMILSLQTLIASTILSVFCATAMAEEDQNWYEIELLIFSNNNVAVEEEENWPVFRETWPNQATWELMPPKPAMEITDTLDLTLIDRSGEIQTLAESNQAQEQLESLNGRQLETVETEANQKDEATDDDTIPHFEQVPEEDLQLVGVAEKLAKANEFNLLLHTGWRQQVVRDAGSQPVYLDETVSSYVIEPETNTNDKTPEEDILNNLLDQSDVRVAIEKKPGSVENSDPSDIPVGPQLSVIHGVASLRMSRFLHFGVDLVYRAPEQDKNQLNTNSLTDLFPMLGETIDESESQKKQLESSEAEVDENVNTPPLNGFNLKATRRVKSRELHYFDHPRFGVIVRLIPWEPPEIDPEQFMPQQTPLGSSSSTSFQFGSL